jgi:hypothetical protein
MDGAWTVVQYQAAPIRSVSLVKKTKDGDFTSATTQLSVFQACRHASSCVVVASTE